MVWVISTVPGFEVDLVPEDGEGFTDPDAGSEHECDQVGKVGLDRLFVGGQALLQEGDFCRSECSGWVLRPASMASTSRTGLAVIAPYRTARFIAPEMTARQVPPVGAPA